MKKRVFWMASIAVGAMSTWAMAQPIGLAELSEESAECIDCHKKQNPVIYQQWGSSKHHRANVSCYECHIAERSDPDVMKDHYGFMISILVTPKDCARCHTKEAEEFLSSHHSKAGRILGSLDNVLADIVEGNKDFKTQGTPEGASALLVNGCWQCHGSEVKILPNGQADPTTYPNSGIGRINPDGTEGSCHACHTRHSFSAAQARHPDTCGKCHLGPDHPQKEIYEESKHGILFFANEDKMNMDSSKWIVGEDYWAAPTCATCHMSATKNQPVTHEIGARISWNNRPPVSVRPEVSDAKMGLPGANLPWQTRRANMQDVCLNCHNKHWVENFYQQYDALVLLYNTKFGIPAKELYVLSKPLKPIAMPFTTKADWAYWELWHHEGRRARHGASMMAPDYTHWHGLYDVAQNFYMHFVPALKEMIEDGRNSGDPAKVEAAQKLEDKLNEVLSSDNHKWYLGQMDPAEKAARDKAREEFKARYK
jgi:nitrate/TMAO reductase-like tetraheme cytochrome c subunit